MLGGFYPVIASAPPDEEPLDTGVSHDLEEAATAYDDRQFPLGSAASYDESQIPSLPKVLPPPDLSDHKSKLEKYVKDLEAIKELEARVVHLIAAPQRTFQFPMFTKLLPVPQQDQAVGGGSGEVVTRSGAGGSNAAGGGGPAALEERPITRELREYKQLSHKRVFHLFHAAIYMLLATAPYHLVQILPGHRIAQGLPMPLNVQSPELKKKQ